MRVLTAAEIDESFLFYEKIPTVFSKDSSYA
jgi:hypothetical protein